MGVITIIVGVLVLVWPELIRWFVGVGLIVLGAIAVMQHLARNT
jgi:uncharacterized membrane protein HdeD (DUF308 family)